MSTPKTKRPFQPVPNTSQVTLDWVVDSIPCKNVLHYMGVGGTNQSPTASDVAPGIIANITAALRNTFTTDTTLQSITVTNLSSNTGLASSYTAGLPLAGTVVAGATPNSASLVVKLLTDKRGRS